MPRESLIEGLNQIEAELVLMGAMVESAIVNAVDTLKTRDLKRARRLVEEDDLLDEKANAVEEMCIELIRREAPIAGDLRRLVSILQIVYQLERIGDYAEGIAKLTIRMADQPLLKELIDIPKMADITLEMLKTSMASHLANEPEKARELFESVHTQDDEVDGLYERVVVELMERMRQDKDDIERGTYLLWVAHNIERMADRAVNIAERAYYEAVGVKPPES